MDKIILFLSIGLIGWWIGNLAGQDQYAQVLGAAASVLEMIRGIAGAGYLFLVASGTH
ncbi:MAG: hypothetical protein ACXWWP_10045 [Candidatus Binatia bacterium]